ncbi:hypothetical protein NP233_g6541 [Leucocoprinus birnbaumii]|uniref:DASH complex subunit DUO1 n=1 Tax=Leucocoprinus birnbaumii TaxID=56174 RepID=A0AAD5YPX8_9AGAR|nr:hypothetical protein NP233_g6541 [Leucocoprinus birnbaumii]
MYNPDESDLTFTADGSRLLSESSLMASESNSSHAGSAHGDLSLSDLSMRDRDDVMRKPFSLLSRPDPTTPPSQTGELGDDLTVRAHGDDEEDEEATSRQSGKAREEKLQSDIFILRKLNASFSAFNEALDATGSINDKIARQLAQTDALLNKYVEILYKSEEVSRLIFDEDWEGAEADEEQLERERQEAIERARREDEERRLAMQREKERLEREEQERKEKEERERQEQEKRDRLAARGGSRGVSRRGVSTRGTARGTTTTGAPRPSVVRPGSGLPTRKTTGSTIGRGTPPGSSTRGIRKT